MDKVYSALIVALRHLATQLQPLVKMSYHSGFYRHSMINIAATLEKLSQLTWSFGRATIGEDMIQKSTLGIQNEQKVAEAASD